MHTFGNDTCWPAPFTIFFEYDVLKAEFPLILIR